MTLSKSARGLTEWCEAERGRAARLADHLGVSRTAINHYCRAVIVPAAERRPAIEAFTEGAAPTDGWKEDTSNDVVSDDERPTLTPDPSARAA